MEKKPFQAESARLLEMMIHSIYTNKDIFLRELISNASDALDKYHFESAGHVNRDDLWIELRVDKDKRELVISDTGIGMSQQELEENLGTIARSGSLAFKQALEKGADVDIIGQFGVGFYSAFMVAKRVSVLSRKADSAIAYLWESDGQEGYTIEESTRPTPGTTITLVLKDSNDQEDFDQYLDQYTLSRLVKKYSDYIRYPIYMDMETSKLKEGTEESEKPEYETVIERRTLNSMVPLWKKAKKDISEDDYKQFYKDHFMDWQEPARTIHFSVEGNLSFTALLYIPSQVPQGFYQQDFEKGLQLYSRGVFIMDHAQDLLPDSLRFVKGLVDSQDLNLNISRELLQQDHQLKAIASRIEKKVLSELASMLTKDREAYEALWKNFGLNLKFGVYNQFGADKDKLQDLLLFYTSHEGKLASLNEIVNRMKEDQKEIYFVSGASVDLLSKLPVVQMLKQKGLEVLYLLDDVDEFVLQTLQSYREKTFKNAAQGDLDLASEEEKQALEKQSEQYKDLLAFLTDSLDEIKEVKLSSRLVDDPVMLSAGEGLSFEMERVFNNMPQNAGMPMKADRILEINPNHPIFNLLTKYYEQDQDRLKEVASVLVDQAKLIEGFTIDDPIAYARKIADLLVAADKN